MKRVVVTGLGIVSSIGTNKGEVLEALRNGCSGIRFNPRYKELGLRCHIDGAIDVDTDRLSCRIISVSEAPTPRLSSVPIFEGYTATKRRVIAQERHSRSEA